MTHSSYDVVLLGLSPEPLFAAALLAKRGFRVLVLGQGELPPSYTVAGTSLPRAPFTFDAAHSPVARRILAELALSQLFRRRSVAFDPALQVVLPRHRFDLALDEACLEREIARELPTVRRAVEELHRQLNRQSERVDTLLDRDLVWPPDGFLERRELQRALQALPFERDGSSPDPLAELPERNAFRLVYDAPSRAFSSLDPSQLPAFAIARHYAAWLRGSVKLEGGYDWLHRTLLDRIRTHGGEVRVAERAERVNVRRGVVEGVVLASGEVIGAGFLVHGGEIASLLRLLPDRAALDPLFERVGEPSPRFFRYTLHVLLRAEGVPEGMARDVLYVRDPARPRVGENFLRLELDDGWGRGSRAEGTPSGRARLTVEALLPRRGVEEVSGYVASQRERILATLSELVPFLSDHAELIDSPHDGRDAQHLATGALIAPEEPWSRGPRTMRAVHGYPVRGMLGVAGLPLRTPLRRLLLCGPHNLPGLGLEGSLVAAWSAARVVTRNDRRREWMRRGLWTRMEI
ncbi:MAG: hypothetical protein H6721_09105 [Sandaracinus sp.]|nr:hypothetical protein [Sandaracinus sp.]MCB9621777.1 hypothetical protein [Sandaracinus sp.]MCB9632274.1 hypothetical protein [Sandaracinus sp.]